MKCNWIHFVVVFFVFFYKRRSRFAKQCTPHNRIKYLGFLFFTRVKYFRCVWRCVLVIACLILQSLIKPKVQQIPVKLQLQSIDSERSLSNFLPELNTKNIANTYTCFDRTITNAPHNGNYCSKNIDCKVISKKVCL